MKTFTCSKCHKIWPDNYCPECSQSIEQQFSAAEEMPPVLTNSAEQNQGVDAPGSRFTREPGNAQPSTLGKSSRFDCTGNFRLLRAEAANPASLKTIASTHGGVTTGHIWLEAESIVLHKHLSVAIGALIFLISWIGSFILLFMAQAIVTEPSAQSAAAGIFMLIALGIGALIPWLVARRMRRFERRFPIREVAQVNADIGVIQFEFRTSLSANDNSGTAAPVLEKLIFSPFTPSHATQICSVLSGFGVPVNERGEAEKSEFLERLTRATPRAWVTPFILGLNVLVFLFMCGSDNTAGVTPSVNTLLLWGADFGPLTVTAQQWWRLLSSCFVHVGFWHLIFNMLALWQVGRIVEKLLGNWFYLALYLGCGLVGSLTSLYFQPQTVSAGASGAIFGIYGALLGIILRQHETLPRSMVSNLIKFGLTFLLYNVYGSLMSLLAQATDPAHGSHIDLACHAGGLVSGLGFGFAAARPLELNSRQAVTKQRSLAFAGCLCALTALLFIPVLNYGSHNLTSYKTLGGMYYRGEGVTKDIATSVRWLQAAAEQGDVTSQKTLGSIYYHGEGTEKNMDAAVRWSIQAAEANDVEAEKFLAGIYFSGQAVPTNYVEGVKWLTKIADQGADQDFSELEKGVAIAYYRGEGLPQSQAEAVKWMTKVAARGDKDAQTKLSAITQGLPSPSQNASGSDQLKIKAAQNLFKQLYKKHAFAIDELLKSLDQATRVDTILSRERLQSRLTSLGQMDEQLSTERQFFLNQPEQLELLLQEQGLDSAVIARMRLKQDESEATIITEVFDSVADYRGKIKTFLNVLDKNWDGWTADSTSTQVKFVSVSARNAYVPAWNEVLQSAQSVKSALQIWLDYKKTKK